MIQTCSELDTIATGLTLSLTAAFEAARTADAALAIRLMPRRVLIEDTVAQVFGVHLPDLRGISRGRAPVALARQVAMYLTHVVFGLSMAQTGRLFGRDRTTVAHACSVIEDLRDDTVFDRVIELLEGIVPVIVMPRPLLTALQH